MTSEIKIGVATKEKLSGMGGVSMKAYYRKWRDAVGKDLEIGKFLANMMFHSAEYMKISRQMAHDDEGLCV